MSNLIYQVNVCRNVSCSFNGRCFEENSKATCACFKNYFGDDCSKETEALKNVKSVKAATSVVAIVTLSIFFVGIMIMDYFKYKRLRLQHGLEAWLVKTSRQIKMISHQPYNIARVTSYWLGLDLSGYSSGYCAIALLHCYFKFICPFYLIKLGYNNWFGIYFNLQLKA